MVSLTFFLIVPLAILALVLLWCLGMYNTLVTMKKLMENAWAQIDVQLKRGRDLIPNLVETIKGCASHEKETLENVTQARSRAAFAQGVAPRAQAQQALTGALGRLMLVAGQYPGLKASQDVLALQEELTSTENRIGFARQHYNDLLMQHNTKTGVAPAQDQRSSPSPLRAGTRAASDSAAAARSRGAPSTTTCSGPKRWPAMAPAA